MFDDLFVFCVYKIVLSQSFDVFEWCYNVF